MEKRRQYLKDKVESVTNVILHTMKAIDMLKDSNCKEHITEAIAAIPNEIFGKIINTILKFNRHDITRAELIKVLEKQIELRKRALHRYLKLYKEEFGNDET